MHRNTASTEELAVSLTGPTESEITPQTQDDTTPGWVCPRCTFENYCALPYCEFCDLLRSWGDPTNPWTLPKKCRRRHHLPRVNDPLVNRANCFSVLGSAAVADVDGAVGVGLRAVGSNVDVGDTVGVDLRAGVDSNAVAGIIGTSDTAVASAVVVASLQPGVGGTTVDSYTVAGIVRSSNTTVGTAVVADEGGADVGGAPTDGCAPTAEDCAVGESPGAANVQTENVGTGLRPIESPEASVDGDFGAPRVGPGLADIAVAVYVEASIGDTPTDDEFATLVRWWCTTLLTLVLALESLVSCWSDVSLVSLVSVLESSMLESSVCWWNSSTLVMLVLTLALLICWWCRVLWTLVLPLELSVSCRNGLSAILLTMAVAEHLSSISILGDHELGGRCDYFICGYATIIDHSIVRWFIGNVRRHLVVELCLSNSEERLGCCSLQQYRNVCSWSHLRDATDTWAQESTSDGSFYGSVDSVLRFMEPVVALEGFGGSVDLHIRTPGVSNDVGAVEIDESTVASGVGLEIVDPTFALFVLVVALLVASLIAVLVWWGDDCVSPPGNPVLFDGEYPRRSHEMEEPLDTDRRTHVIGGGGGGAPGNTDATTVTNVDLLPTVRTAPTLSSLRTSLGNFMKSMGQLPLSPTSPHVTAYQDRHFAWFANSCHVHAMLESLFAVIDNSPSLLFHGDASPLSRAIHLCYVKSMEGAALSDISDLFRAFFNGTAENDRSSCLRLYDGVPTAVVTHDLRIMGIKVEEPEVNFDVDGAHFYDCVNEVPTAVQSA